MKTEYTQRTESQPDNREERWPKVKTKKGGVKEKAKKGESISSYGVCSRKCCLLDLRVVVSLFSRAKETGLLSS